MSSSDLTERQPRGLEISPEARIQWLEGRAGALERQIECRVRQVQALEQRLGILMGQAQRYDELMQTWTMRILRRPRAVYAWLRRFGRDRDTRRSLWERAAQATHLSNGSKQQGTGPDDQLPGYRGSERMSDERAPHVAFRTWEAGGESLSTVEARIHDGVPSDQLHKRADDYLDTFETWFPDARPRTGGDLMEIGSGVGYIMEAALRRYAPKKIVGLDIASGMIEKARQRLERDAVDTHAIEFLHYDGVNVPRPSASFDFIYSVASLQHAPRPYCFRAMMEANRLIRPAGSVYVHLLAYSHFKEHMTPALFVQEVDRQIEGREEHWHHYYSRDEIQAVLTYGVGVKQLRVHEQGGSLFICFRGGR